MPVEASKSQLTDRLWWWYLAAGIPLTLVYLLLPADTAKLVLWPMIGWSSVIAILIGVRLNRPDAPLVWYLLATGVAMLMIGDNLYTFRSLVQHSETLFPSYVDVVYLAVYPFLISGLAILVLRRTSGRDRAGFIDAAIITAVLAMASYVLLIGPYVRIDDVGILERLTSIAYPVADIALLATAARLAVGGGRRPLAFWLLAGSLVPLLAADALYGYLNLAGTWHEHNPVDIGWSAFYIGWGAAALHPSMRTLSRETANKRRINGSRLIVIGSAVLVPPAVLFIEDLRGVVRDATAIAAASTILFALVLVRIAGLARDAAEEKSETRFRALVDNASDAIVVLDPEGRVRYRTPSTDRIFGRSEAELDGRKLSELLEEIDQTHLVMMRSQGSATATVEWRIQRGDGGWRDLEVVTADLRSVTGVAGLVLTMRDITERKQFDVELRLQALHDSLTGLANRTLFVDRTDQALKRAERVDGSIAVLLLDIDDFKDVNDRLGHAAGNELLQAGPRTRLTIAMGSGITVARLGGDEFALLIECDGADGELEVAAHRVQTSLERPFLIRDEAVPVRVSIGIAVGSTRTHTPDDVLRDADMAMYVAKRKGKDRFEQYLPVMHEEANRRLEIAAALRGAIDRDELVVFFQPIVDLRSRQVLGAEALVRWQHPERGLLSPGEFIPIAEATGVVIPLGRWVLQESCRMAAAWREAGIADESFYVSVNLSARHIQDKSVIRDVRTALDQSGLAPDALVIEVTETALVEDLRMAASKLATLKLLGLRIAVDDFGTGYSSLSYLSNFPIDIIKLDKSFVDQVAATSEGETLARAVLDLARTLQLTAIAEGVEQPEQALALERLGCHLAQGFLFARPMPATKMAALLEQQSMRLGLTPKP